MSSQRYAAPLRLRLEPSPSLFVLYSFLLGGGLLSLWLVEPPWLPGMIASLLALGLYASVLRRHVWLSAPAAIRELVWEGDGIWRLLRADGSEREARLRGDSFVHPYLVVLNFRQTDGRPCSVLLIPGRVSAADLRRLRVRLKLEGVGDQATDLL